MFDLITPSPPLAVVPVLVGPLPALLALLPGLLVALGGVLLAMFKPSTMKKLALLLWAQKWVVLVVIAVAFALFFFAPRLLAGKATVSAAANGADWPLWRGSLERLGACPERTRGSAGDADDPTQGTARWRFTDGKMTTFYSSPAVVGNRVYVASANYGYFTDTGAVYSLDADTGKVVWSYNAGGYRATFSSPAVSGKYLVIGEGLHLTKDSRVHCLDVEASEKAREGVLLWSFRTKSHVESSPAIALVPSGNEGDGKAVIGAGDDGLYCFALDGDGKGNAKVLWHLEGDKYPDCESSPAVADGKVYFCLGNAGQAIVCVELATGKELWRVAAPYPVFGSPTIALVPNGREGDGKLFVGMGTGNYVETAEEVAAKERAKMEKEGKTAAEIDAAVKRMGPIGEVWCIDLGTHEVAWKYPVPRTVLGAVAAADGKLYFGSRDKNLYCVTTGGKLAGKWNARAPIVTSPAIGKSHVYVVTAAGTLFALDRESLSPVWQLDLGAESMSSPAVARGHVYVGTTGQGFLCAGEPGKPAKQVWEGYLGGPGKSGWDGSPVGDRGRFAWRWPAPAADGSAVKIPKITAPAAYQDGILYLATSFDNVTGLTGLKLPEDASGAPVEKPCAPGEFKVAGEPSRKLIVNNIAFTASGFEEAPKFIATDAPTGGMLWQTRGPGRITTGPVLAAGKIWVGGNCGLASYDTATGEAQVRQYAYLRGALVVDGNRVACVNKKGEIRVVDAETREEIADVEGATPELPPMLAGRYMLYFTPAAIMRYDFETKKSATWYALPEWMGAPTSPMIMLKSRVYFGTDKVGLVCIGPRR